MGWNGRKTLKTLLGVGLIGGASMFSSCEKEDTIPPKIHIRSPLEKEVFYSKEIPFEWEIEEENFSSAWYSTDNEKTKKTIGKLGAEFLTLKNGSRSIVVGSEDLSNNISKESVNFYVKDPFIITINPFVQPNDSTLNWYGSGDVNNDNALNSQDLDRIVELINGTYSNPNDRRLYDRADVNGDGVVNSQDRQLLENKLGGSLAYLPAYWNELNREEKMSWSKKMFDIDKTDENPFPGGNCTQYSEQTMINFHGFGDKEDISKLLEEYPYDFSDNCRFNIPVYQLALMFYNSLGKQTGAHGMNVFAVDKSILKWDYLCKVEPQFDHFDIQIGEDYLDGLNTEVYIRGRPTNKYAINNTGLTEYVRYFIKNNIPNEGEPLQENNLFLEVIYNLKK